MIKKVLGSLPYPVYSRGLALRNFLREMPDPVLIYQMGKVGSSTVREMLTEANVSNIHVHFIHESSRRARIKFRRESGDGVPPHVYLGGLLDWWLRATRKKVKIITLVRDPVACRLSGTFELAHVIGFPADHADQSLRTLASSIENGLLENPFNWFDDEFRPVLDVDIFAHPFDREAGWTRITTPRFDILALTLERLDDLTPTVLSEFVGCDLQPTVERARTADVYQDVKQEMTLSDGTLSTIYEHPNVRHFYSDRQRKQFMDRWATQDVTPAPPSRS